MKFILERDVLADAVTWVAHALPNRPPSPILSGVRITASQQGAGTVTMVSFDYEVSTKVEVQAAVETAGEVLVSGKLLAEISRLLPSQPVELTVEGPKVVITCGSAVFTLLTMPLDDYPSLPKMPELGGVVDSAIFSQAVGQVAIAATRDETLPLLTGIRIEFDGEKMVLLATDRYRLAIRELIWTPSSPDRSGVALVRAKTLTDVARSFLGAGSITVDLSPGPVTDIIGFEAEGRHMTSLLIEGDYPPIRNLLPQEATIGAVVAVSQLVEATRRVALVAERHTPIQFSFSAGQVLLNAGTGEDAQASEVLEAELTGEEISVAFNPAYLLNGLEAIATPYVKLSMSHPNKPVLFEEQATAEGPSRSDYRYLLVPIRFPS